MVLQYLYTSQLIFIVCVIQIIWFDLHYNDVSVTYEIQACCVILQYMMDVGLTLHIDLRNFYNICRTHKNDQHT